MTDAELCQLAGLVRLEPFPEGLLVGETPARAGSLLDIFSSKYSRFVVVVFQGGKAYVKGRGLHFSKTVEERDEFVAEMREKAARLGCERVGGGWDKELWRAFYRSQTIPGRDHSNPRWCMPKKWDGKLDISFETAQFARQGNSTLAQFC